MGTFGIGGGDVSLLTVMPYEEPLGEPLDKILGSCSVITRRSQVEG